MTEIFKQDYIFMDEQFKSRDEAFTFIADKAVELTFGDDVNLILKALHQREQEASTGLQDGIAIPHAISTHLQQPAVLYIRSATPITDWPTFDEQPVTEVIAMLVPKNSEQEHLQILSDFASALVDEDERQALLASQTSEQVYDVLTKPTNTSL